MNSISDRLNNALRKIPNWALYALAPLPPLWLLYTGLTDQLGANPVKAMERQLGLWSLQLLVFGLAITPLRRFTGVNFLKLRRTIGVITFIYLALHLLVWLVLDVQILAQIKADIIKRPYIGVGMTGFILLLPLAITSNNFSVRQLGAGAWRNLHRLVYIAVFLGAVHYNMQAKGFQIEPLVYLACVVLLLGLRLIPRSARRKKP